MEKLTAKQQKIYDYIQTFSAEHGYPPSVREIGAAVGLKSPSTVHFHLKGLEEAGVIIKAEGKTRAITLSGTGRPVAEEQDPHADQIPVVGSVAAGSPILAEECIEDYLGPVRGALRPAGAGGIYAGRRHPARGLSGGPPPAGGPQR